MIQSGQSQFRRVMMLVGIGYMFFMFSDPQGGIIGLALKVILKDQLHLNPTKIASFFAIASMPWYFKPLAGLLTDNFPLLGTRRKGYLVVSTLLAGVLWIFLAIIPTSYGLNKHLAHRRVASCQGRGQFGKGSRPRSPIFTKE